MSSLEATRAWSQAPSTPLALAQRLDHVRYCSPFVAAALDQHPQWADHLDEHRSPTQRVLAEEISLWGLDPGLRRYRNQQQVRIIWRDLTGLASLEETFADLTSLAELCLEAAIRGNLEPLQEKFGTPADEQGDQQALTVLGLGKFGGGELNLSSDIDIIFCYGKNGQCLGSGKRSLSNEQFFTRLARAVITSLSEVTEEGFCFRVDTRLRPFGDSGPLCASQAALEQYYQREGRDWERYALIKARPVAGDLTFGLELMEQVRPFVYRRYIDFTAIEALQHMHDSVSKDARLRDRMDDIKRGPGGIREIEFLVQCFQLLRGGREFGLQTASLGRALACIEELGILDTQTVTAIVKDYLFLRRLENRIQAQRDQQTHCVPGGDDLPRLVQAMGFVDKASLNQALNQVRQNVSERFRHIFPAPAAATAEPKWIELWRQKQLDRQASPQPSPADKEQAFSVLLRSLERLPLSQRAHRRLDQFMPVLLHRLDRLKLEDRVLHRVFDLVLAISRRSPYLVLLVQNAPALDRLIGLFARSEWIAASVIRFPALLDELIDPSLGRQIPDTHDLSQSVARLLASSQGTEAVLEGLNYLKQASVLRIAVSQLEGNLDNVAAQSALAGLAEALLQGVLELATAQIEERHGPIASTSSALPPGPNSLAIIAYGSFGALEPVYDSDLDIVFLFSSQDGCSHGVLGGKGALPAERYYARLAQRVLSYLAVMTPSGRLYPVDTRLRPNGRSGSLVSSLDAFAQYQNEEAWTWELQALTRARFLGGNPGSGKRFRHIRRQVLGQARDPGKLREALSDMRKKMTQEHARSDQSDSDPKHQRGGLVDIEFVCQLGVLACAAKHPSLIEDTSTLGMLSSLSRVGWLDGADAHILDQTFRALHRYRMLKTLTSAEHDRPPDTSAAAKVYERLLV